MANNNEIPTGNRPLPMSATPMPETAAERKARLKAFAEAARKNGMPDVADQYDRQNGVNDDPKSRERAA